MATTTPNFGWPVPTSTDLVKDGATAIEALGDSIDASLLDLKGGTTGQVLSKTTNSNMDFTWVTTDDANAIQNSIVDAKGDLISATANDTPARLAVGSNGETLVADSSTSTGLRYQAPVAANPVLNSAMQVWQRGTSISIAASAGITYTADRWSTATGASQATTVSRQATNDTTNLPFIQYAMRYQRNSGQTGTNALSLWQSFETVNSIPYSGKTVTFSFYARAGANYSATSSALGVVLYGGTGTDQNIGSGYTGTAVQINQTATLTTTWQRFTYTGTISSTITELTPLFSFTPTGTASTNDYYEVTGIQLEVGSVATPFKTNGATFQGELSAAMRYYQRFGGQAAYQTLGSAMSNTTTNVYGLFSLPVPMRVIPTSVDFSTLTYQQSDGGLFTISAAAFNSPGLQCVRLDMTTTGATANRPGQILTNNSTSGYVGFSAEL